MKVKKRIDSAEEIMELKQFIKNYVQSHSFIKSLVLGISGGEYSTLVGKLVQMSVNELREEGIDCTFIAVKLPYGVQKDADEVDQALRFIEPDEIATVNIKPAVDQSVQSLKKLVLSDRFPKGNEKARETYSKVQFSIASNRQGIVVGTDHSAKYNWVLYEMVTALQISHRYLV